MASSRTLETIAYDRLKSHSRAVDALLSHMYAHFGTGFTHLNPEGELRGEIPGIIYDYEIGLKLKLSIPSSFENLASGYILQSMPGNKLHVWRLERFYPQLKEILGTTEKTDSLRSPHDLPHEWALSQVKEVASDFLSRGRYHLLTFHPLLTPPLVAAGPMPRVVSNYFGSREEIKAAGQQAPRVFDADYLLSLKYAGVNPSEAEKLVQAIISQPDSDFSGLLLLEHPEKRNAFVGFISAPLQIREKKK